MSLLITSGSRQPRCNRSLTENRSCRAVCHLQSGLSAGISLRREDSPMPSFHWISPVLSQQVMKGLHGAPPQSALVVQRMPQPHWQNPTEVFSSFIDSCSNGKESVLCSVRSGCSTVLKAGSGAVPGCPLAAGDELAKTATARADAMTSILNRNLVLGISSSPL